MRGSESCTMKRFIAAGTSAVLLLSSAQAGRSPTAGGRLVSGTLLQEPGELNAAYAYDEGALAAASPGIALQHRAADD